MGIGNKTLGTPRRANAATHYPSWGSGTLARAVEAALAGVLTTPHGDRELKALHALLAESASHYPSWGSGT